MRWLLIIVVSLSTSATLNISAMRQPAAQAADDASPRVVLDNPRVRVYRTTAGSRKAEDHQPAVIVRPTTVPGAKAGSAVWVEDAAAPLAIDAARLDRRRATA